MMWLMLGIGLRFFLAGVNAQIGGGWGNIGAGNGVGNGFGNNGIGNGMGNGNGNFISGGGSGISSTCTNGNCRTCINGRCYDRGYGSVTTYANCPVTACENNGCKDVVFSDKDNCPICDCNGFSTREPCSSNSDCLSPNGNCTSNLCRYPPVPPGLPKLCAFAHQCPETDNCIQSKCQPDPANRRHMRGQACVFAHMCPSGYACEGMTCWEGGSQHTGGFCTFDYQCPTKYSCQQQTCVYTGREHGTSMCFMPNQCPSGQNCISMTCQ